MDLNKIYEEFKFSENEKEFMKESAKNYTSEISQNRIISEFILGKKIEKSVDKIISCNESLAKSNEKYARAMIWLTVGLVSVGVMQIIAQLIS